MQVQINFETEVWKDVVGYEGLYIVSNRGQVKSLRNQNERKEKTLKPGKLPSGYRTVILCKGGVPKQRYVHRLVSESFISNRDNKPEVNHINGIRYDNNLSNLGWCTTRENVSHAYSTKAKTSKYTGVNTNKNKNKRWSASIWHGKKIHLGNFHNEYDAHCAYQKKLSEITGLKTG